MTTVNQTAVPASESGLPRLFVTETAGLRPYRIASVALAVGALAVLAVQVTTPFLPPENALLLVMAFCSLAIGAMASLYRGCRRSELWLDVRGGRYRARWNRLGEGRAGPLAELASVAAKPSEDASASEVWLSFKSLDRDPLLVATFSDPAEAEALRSQLAELIDRAHAAAPAQPGQSKPEVPGGAATGRYRSKDSPGSQLCGGLILLMLTLPLLAWGLHDRQLRGAFEDHARRAQGSVTGRQVHHGRNNGVSYSVSYKFDVAGKTWLGESIVLHTFYRRATYQSPTMVEYLPEEPRASRLVVALPGEGGFILFAGLAFGAIGALIAISGLRRLNAPGVES